VASGLLVAFSYNRAERRRGFAAVCKPERIRINGALAVNRRQRGLRPRLHVVHPAAETALANASSPDCRSVAASHFYWCPVDVDLIGASSASASPGLPAQRRF
jgi:hypothetical protein